MSNADEPKGFFQRLRQRLNRGTSSMARDLRALVRGRKIDDEALEELETRLLSADVGVDATTEILEELRAGVSRHDYDDVEALLAALRKRLADILRPAARPLQVQLWPRPPDRPFVVLVVGVNGSGKTTTIGKLASHFRGMNASVLLAAGDTFRAAAVEQLNLWAQRTGALFSAQSTGADPASVLFDAVKSAQARNVDIVLADTAGRLQAQSHLMEELKKIKRVIGRVMPEAPHEVLLVLDANQGQNAMAQAAQFHEALGVTGLVLTKLDGTARGGVAVAITRRFGLPIRFIGIGEGADDFGPFDADAFAAALVDGNESSGTHA